jgi:hypothetical protein
VDVNFEFLQKLGVDYFCFHDRDIAPEGATLEETNKNLETVVAAIKKKMQETGIKLLWGTANLFSNPRYMNGASTNPGTTTPRTLSACSRRAEELWWVSSYRSSSELVVARSRCARVCLRRGSGQEVHGHLQGARCRELRVLGRQGGLPGTLYRMRKPLAHPLAHFIFVGAHGRPCSTPT